MNHDIYYVYVIQSNVNNKLYIGHTSDLDRRIRFHNSGRQRFTKKWLPYRLVYSEKYATKSEAFKKERFYKTGRGRLHLKELLKIGV